MADNLQDLDQGTLYQFVKTYMGPTLGWQMLPVMPEVLYDSTSPLVLSPYTSRVILQAACKLITLPNVTQWWNAQPPLANQAAFDRSIWIKDFAYTASPSAPIVIQPYNFGLPFANSIDGQSQFSIVEAGQLIRLYPLVDLSGWYVG